MIGRLQRVRDRAADLAELLGWIRRRRSWWVAALIAGLLVLAAITWAAQSALVAPYVYPLF